MIEEPFNDVKYKIRSLDDFLHSSILTIDAICDDGAGAKYPLQFPLACHLEDIVQSVDVHIPGKLRVLLAYRREDGGHVIDSVNPVFVYHCFDGLPVNDVDDLGRARLSQGSARLGAMRASHHMLTPIKLAQLHR